METLREKLRKLFEHIPPHFRKKRVLLGLAIVIFAILKTLNVPIVEDVYYEVIDRIIDVLSALGFIV